ncbi:DUF3237 family protein [Maribacter litoralis]|uniref:DUF3237 domain-containing protein n=1 Tax=Maribacter litoralis TaxID=2059726 RepID=A0A653XDM4_9FLAO|nr:DUF3237 family protein [Maribacter litoralis]VXC28125.1 conserved hypothetical protein [Maribacter litoralis]
MNIQVEELIYTANFGIKGLTEFGYSFEDMITGQKAIPAEGSQFNILLEGEVKGEKLNGKFEAIDYMRVRNDGGFELSLFGTITVEEGIKIAWSASGTALPNPETGQMFLNEEIKMFTNNKKYNWVNNMLFWGRGVANLATQELEVKVYKP